MLRTRILTAAVLLALLLPTLLVGSPLPFALLSLLFVAAGMAEWAALAGVRAAAARGAVAVAWAIVAAAILYGLDAAGWVLPAETIWLWGLMAAMWLVLLLASLPRARAPALLRSGLPGVLLGGLLLGVAWLALVALRVKGSGYLLSLLALVWAADIAAYFGGRAWGRRKLAPAISPGKTWAGVWSALVAVLVYAALWLALGAGVPNVFADFLANWGGVGWVVCVVALLVFAIAGDLFESLLKRAAAVKDSGRLLPGHGGVLDRIDALLPVLPLAMFFLAR